MALETFDYPDGTSGASITGATVTAGSFSTQDGKLTSTSETINKILWQSQSDGFQVLKFRAKPGGEQNCGILFRQQDNDNTLACIFNATSGLLRTSKVVGGVYTETANNTYPIKNLTDYVTMIVRHVGTSITVWIDGSQRISITDDSGITGTQSGVRMDFAGNYEVMSFQYWDSPNYAAITDQPNDFQVIPRTSSTGGLFSKGEAASSFTVTLAGSLEYRLVSEDLATEIYTWQSFTSGVETTFTVPADAQWYRLQFRVDGTDTFYSNRFGCGGITRIDGQSLSVRMFRSRGDATSMLDLGITPSEYHSVCAIYYENVGHQSPIWSQYKSETLFDSAFVEFANKKIETEGVVWALAGMATGGEDIANFLPSGDDGANMQSVTDALGGWHEWWWFQGHSDANAKTTRANYLNALTSIYNSHQSYNSISNVDVYATAIPNINSELFGTELDRAQIRLAQKDFCDNVGGTVINPMDIDLHDGIHQSQLGSVTLASHLYRAQYDTHIGTSITGFTRTGAVLELELNIPDNSGDLVSGGNLSKVISVSLQSDPWAFLPVDSIVVGTDSVTVTLVSDPATDDLHVLYGVENGSTNGDWIRDSYSLDSFSNGRDFNSNLQANTYEGAIIPPDTNTPPTANAGPDQSVEAGATFTLDGSASADTNTGGTIVEYRWTQPAGDTVALDLTDPIRPVGVAPSTANAQTLTFSLITVDDQDAESVADTVDIHVAAEVEDPVENNDLLEAVSKQKFVIQPTAVMPAFTGRSNIEELKFKLGSTNELISLDNQGYYNFDENETDRVIVITDAGEISSENGDIEWEGSSLYVRFGAFSAKDSHLSGRVVVFLAGDERGVVFAGPGLPANLMIRFN